MKKDFFASLTKEEKERLCTSISTNKVSKDKNLEFFDALEFLKKNK